MAGNRQGGSSSRTRSSPWGGRRAARRLAEGGSGDAAQVQHGLGPVGHDVHPRAALDGAQVPHLGAQFRIAAKRKAAHGRKPVQQVQDGAVPQFRAAAVGGPAAAGQGEVLHAALAGGQLELGGLAVDQRLAALEAVGPGMGFLGAQAVRLLACNPEPGEAGAALGEEPVQRQPLGDHLALGVATAAAVEDVPFDPGREEGRHGVQVGREEDARFAPGGEHVAPARSQLGGPRPGRPGRAGRAAGPAGVPPPGRWWNQGRRVPPTVGAPDLAMGGWAARRPPGAREAFEPTMNPLGARISSSGTSRRLGAATAAGYSP